MNLTLKQLFKFGAACTCACALSATAATNYVADSFEVSDGGSEGLAISQYKYTTDDSGQIETTNYAWFAETGDASTIETNDTAYTGGDGPIADGASLLALNLATEGNTLSRTVGVSFVSSGAVYVDTLVKFTPSEDAPNLGSMSDLKIALWVNSESNLVVNHDYYYQLETDYAQVETNSVIDLGSPIDPDQWYRLTLVVTNDSFGDKGCQIYVDGTILTHDNAFDIDGDQNGGANGNLFLNSDSSTVVQKVSFQGTGMLDEFVASDTLPDFGGGTAIEITLVSQGGTVTFSSNPVNSGDTVTITATDDWKWLASLDGPVTEAGVVDADSITTTLTAVASCTVTAVVEYADNDQTIGNGDYPFSSVGPWAEANGLTEDSDFTGLEDDYLLNVAPDTDATISIIDTASAGSTITITVGSSDPAVDLQDLNGTLKLYSRTSLTSGTWTLVGTNPVGGTAAAADISFTAVNPTDFFKAVVE